MPTYEYACKACDHEFERDQRITEDPIKTCPACGAKKARRLISRTSFVLKGGGWYSDLYSSPGSKKGDGADGTDASASKGDTTSAATSDTGAADAKSSSKDGAKKKKKDAPASGGSSKDGKSTGGGGSSKGGKSTGGGGTKAAAA